MWHIFVKNLSSSPDAIVGVSLIGIYFVWMVSMALMRCYRGEHVHH
jgi:hypothetical protein